MATICGVKESGRSRIFREHPPYPAEYRFSAADRLRSNTSSPRRIHQVSQGVCQLDAWG